MSTKSSNLNLKFQLFYPVLIALILSLILFTLFLVKISRESIYFIAEKDMMLEVSTIKKMFERENALKLEKVETDLRVAHNLFYEKKITFSDKTVKTTAINQITGKKQEIELKQMMWGNEPLLYSKKFPDFTQKLLGGTTTIFQKIDSGFIRISTNVRNNDKTRAFGTYIPNTSIVSKTVSHDSIYYGRAYVVNDWYITAYEPIVINNKIEGMLYVGSKEKDIDKLINTLKTLTLVNTGFSFVINNDLNIIVSPDDDRKKIITKELAELTIQNSGKVFHYKSSVNNVSYLIAVDYYPDFDYYIVATVPTGELTDVPISTIVFSSLAIGSIMVVLLVVLMLSTTTRRVHRLLNAIRLSNVKLRSTQEALRRSEENFETIFESSSDEIFVSDMQGNIIEVNKQATNLLGYTKEELLTMNILDLMPLKLAEKFLMSRDAITKEGGHLFDSEYITKNNIIVPVEINSRVIEFNGIIVILSISRNLVKRKETERKVLSAVIQTEEKERERFSKDMHDGIGPLLSTIKLYVNELGTPDIGKDEKKQFVEQINKMLDDAVTSIREISNNLMPRVIHEYGLVKALEAFCLKINQTGKIHVDFNADKLSSTLDKNVQLILFRVISELLTNTIKHAKAGKAYVHLQQNGDSINLTFTDNGIGFDSKKVMSDKNTGIGLKSIVSRIKSINGSCEITSSEGKGFRIDIEI